MTTGQDDRTGGHQRRSSGIDANGSPCKCGGTAPLLTYIAARGRYLRFGRGEHRTGMGKDQGMFWNIWAESWDLIKQVLNFSKVG